MPIAWEQGETAGLNATMWTASSEAMDPPQIVAILSYSSKGYNSQELLQFEQFILIDLLSFFIH